MRGSAAVQDAIFDALVAAGVSGGRVYDDIPKKPAFPYVQIGVSQAVQNDVQCREGGDEFIDLHVWSRQRGQMEAKQVMDAVHTALHDQPLTVTGRDVTLVRIDRTRMLMDPDGITRHGVVTVRIHHTQEV